MTTSSAANLIFNSTTPSFAQVDNIAAGALGRGIDSFMAGNYDNAIREFKRTIALAPYTANSFNAFDYMATAQMKNGKPADAEKTYKQAIKIFPSADGLHLNLGNLLFAEGRYEEATEHYAIAVKINPTDSENRYSLGQGYLASGKYDDAEAQFQKVIAMQPRDSDGYYALGQTYRQAGKLDEAETQLEKSLTLNDDFAYAHFELGMLYAEQRQITLAVEQLDMISEELPDPAEKLQNKIYEKAEPRFLSAYSNGLNLASTAGTKVSSLDSSLATPEATKNFTVNFVFNKDMNISSVQDINNWGISRSTSYRTGGPYNWGISTPPTEIGLSHQPEYVIYDPETLSAKVTFSIAQNSSGDGTVDLSHLVFKFNGMDSYGNAMDSSADEYNVISEVV
jgi:tetratricopeptide (TPR) repeat protein